MARKKQCEADPFLALVAVEIALQVMRPIVQVLGQRTG